MISADTKVSDIDTHVYLGEYDPNGVIGKLCDLRVYIDCYLNHKDQSQRGVQIYFDRYTFETLVKNTIDKSHHPQVTFSEFRTLGQGMYGKIAYCSKDMSVKDVIQFLESFHLRLVLTKHKPLR